MKEKLKTTASQCWGNVLYDFIPQETTEIAVTKGERVTIHNEVRGWLFIETKAGNYGYVPLKYCTVNGTAPRRDPMELKVRLCRQGHKISGDQTQPSKCSNNNSMRLKAHMDNKSDLNTKCINNNDARNTTSYQERLDNDVNVSLKRAIATPILVAYARKSTISKDYCVEGQRLTNPGKTNRDARLIDSLCPDVSSEHSEMSDSISSLEETSSVNSSQPDSVRSDDVMDSTPSAFLPVMLTKNPDLPVPDDSTTDSGFSMDEDNDFAESERYKQILKRKAVDVFYKQNYEALKIPALKVNPVAHSSPHKQPVCNVERSLDIKTDFDNAKPQVPAKSIPFHERVSVGHLPESQAHQPETSQGSSSVEVKTKRRLEDLPRVPVITKPNAESSRPEGSTFLSRFAVRRSSKEILARKERAQAPPKVAKKPSAAKVASFLKRQDAVLSSVAAKRLPGSRENLLDDQSDSLSPSIPLGRLGSLDCLLDEDDASRNVEDNSRTEDTTRLSEMTNRLHHKEIQNKDACQYRWQTSPVKDSSLGAKRWGSMECLLDRMSDKHVENESRLRSTSCNRAGSVESLLDTSCDYSFDVDTKCDTRLRNTSTPPRPIVIDLRGEWGGADNKETGNRCRDDGDFQSVKIQSPSPNVGLARSPQVLETFRTWLDSDESSVANDGTPNSSIVETTSQFSRVTEHNVENNTVTKSTSVDQKTRSCIYGTSIHSHSLGADKNSMPSHVTSSENSNIISIRDTGNTIISERKSVATDECSISNCNVQNVNNGANEIADDKPMDFESSAINPSSSDDITKDRPSGSLVVESGSKDSSPVSQLTKPRNKAKIRRVQSLKETTTRRREKRRVDWGPCVQVHFYDPESQIDSEDDHVCRTTAMDFANTLEYEGSLV